MIHWVAVPCVAPIREATYEISNLLGVINSTVENQIPYMKTLAVGPVAEINRFIIVKYKQ